SATKGSTVPMGAKGPCSGATSVSGPISPARSRSSRYSASTGPKSSSPTLKTQRVVARSLNPVALPRPLPGGPAPPYGARREKTLLRPPLRLRRLEFRRLPATASAANGPGRPGGCLGRPGDPDESGRGWPHRPRRPRLPARGRLPHRRSGGPREPARAPPASPPHGPRRSRLPARALVLSPTVLGAPEGLPLPGHRLDGAGRMGANPRLGPPRSAGIPGPRASRPPRSRRHRARARTLYRRARFRPSGPSERPGQDRATALGGLAPDLRTRRRAPLRVHLPQPRLSAPPDPQPGGHDRLLRSGAGGRGRGAAPPFRRGRALARRARSGARPDLPGSRVPTRAGPLSGPAAGRVADAQCT